MAQFDEINETIDKAEANTIINFDSTDVIGMFRIGSTANTKIKVWYYEYKNEVIISWPNKKSSEKLNGEFSKEPLYEFKERSPDPTNGTCLENWSEIK